MRLYQTFFGIVCLFCFISNSQTNKQYTIPHTGSEIITIDGTLDEPIWQQTAFTDSFVISTTGAQGDLTIRAKLLWDDQNLYLGFISDDPDMVAVNTAQDSDLYEEDDLVEIFLDPDGDGKNYLEIGISPRETYYDFIIINPSENNWQDDTQWDVENFVRATSVNGTLDNAADTDSSWSVEMQIPFASLDYSQFGLTLPVTAGDTWRGNLYRIDYDHTTQNSQPNEEYAWNLIGPLATYPLGFHSPTRFGSFVFSGSTGRIQLTMLPCRHNSLSVTKYSQSNTRISSNGYIFGITITNPMGRCIFEESHSNAIEIYWNTAHVPCGIYFITCRTEYGIITGKYFHTGL